MSRKQSVDLVMRRAYRKRDVETVVWSFLKLTEEEIKAGVRPRDRTFNGRDLNGFIQNLIHLEKIRGERGDEKTEAVNDGLEGWVDDEDVKKLPMSAPLVEALNAGGIKWNVVEEEAAQLTALDDIYTAALADAYNELKS